MSHFGEQLHIICGHLWLSDSLSKDFCMVICLVLWQAFTIEEPFHCERIFASLEGYLPLFIEPSHLEGVLCHVLHLLKTASIGGYLGWSIPRSKVQLPCFVDLLHVLGPILVEWLHFVDVEAWLGHYLAIAPHSLEALRFVRPNVSQNFTFNKQLHIDISHYTVSLTAVIFCMDCCYVLRASWLGDFVKHFNTIYLKCLWTADMLCVGCWVLVFSWCRGFDKQFNDNWFLECI